MINLPTEARSMNGHSLPIDRGTFMLKLLCGKEDPLKK